MKSLLKNGIIILIVAGILYLIYLRECRRPEECPPDGMVLLPESTWDSVCILADKPPEVRIDTFWMESEPVIIISPLPEPVKDPPDTTVNEYSDSLVNEEIAVWIDFRLRGELLYRQWRYIPKIMEIKQETKIKVPKIVNNPVPVSRSGIYISGIAGLNIESFVFGGSIDYINKKDHLYGYMYQRYDDKNFHCLKIGTRLGRRK